MPSKAQLEARTTEELRKLAREAGHEGISRLRKAELVSLLAAAEDPVQPTADESPAREGGRPAWVPRLVGGLMQLFGLSGLALGAIGLIALPVAAGLGVPRVERALRASAGSVRSLATTAGDLRAILVRSDQSLQSAAEALRSVQASLEGAEPLLDSTDQLVGEELPTSIETIREALLAAESGASAMDQVLRAFRLFGVDYDPNQPLDEGLAATAGGLEPLPESLRGTAQDLAESRRDLDRIGRDLGSLASNLAGLAGRLSNAADSLERQEADLADLAEQLDRWADRSTVAVWSAAIVFGLGLIWLLLLNAALFAVGGDLRTPWSG